MHDELFKQPAVVARYRAGPYAEARERFLKQARAEGYSRSTLGRDRLDAAHCGEGSSSPWRKRQLHTAEELALPTHPAEERAPTIRACSQPASSLRRRLAAQHGCIATRSWSAASLCSGTERVYGVHACRARSLAGYNHDAGRADAQVLCLAAVAGAIARRSHRWPDRRVSGSAKPSVGGAVAHCMLWAAACAASFGMRHSRGGAGPVSHSASICHVSTDSKTFPKRRPSYEVNQLLEATASGNDPVTIRDHAILSLLIHYGLRRGEVERLTLDDVDWVAETIHITRSKLRRPQCYPLSAPVGEAILRYLREVRPRCAHRAVFLTINAPFRPLSGASISAMVRSRLSRAGREARPHRRALSASCMCGPASGCRLHLEADRGSSRSSQHEQHAHLYEDRSPRPASGGRAGPGSAAMSTASIITSYIEHNRCLGKRFRSRSSQSCPRSADPSAMCRCTISVPR